MDRTLLDQFEEYVSAALSSVKYRDFIGKGENSGVIITGGTGTKTLWILHDIFSDLNLGGHPSSTEDFNPLWISEFKATNAYEVWERTTDPLLFDIVEPR